MTDPDGKGVGRGAPGDSGVVAVGTAEAVAGPGGLEPGPRWLETLRTAVRWFSLALLALLILTPIAQVAMRGLFNLPFSGAEELARYFLVCLTFIGASWVTRQGGQIRMEELQALLPARPRWYLQMLIELSGVAVFLVFLLASLVTIADNLENQTATLELPFWLFMGPLAVGAVLMIIETFATFLHTLRRGEPEAKQTTLT